MTGSPDITVASVTASGNVSVGGTLTYEDVTNIDSVGIVTARTGVRVTAGGLVVTAGVSTFAADASIADKIVHTGDTNTAIRFPAADTFTVETGGSEALRVDNGQKVLINQTTQSVSHPLQVTAASDAHAIAINGRSADDIGELTFFENDQTTRLGELQFRQDHALLRCRVGDIRFTTAGTDERMRITSTGGVHFNNAELIERVKITAGKLSDNTNIDLDNGMVHYFTTTETSAAVPNITSSVGINTSMATGDTMSVTIVTTAAAAAFAGTFAIDHKQVGVTTFFSGGAPTEGGSSGKDVTALTIVKTGDAAFDVLASVTNFE